MSVHFQGLVFEDAHIEGDKVLTLETLVVPVNAAHFFVKRYSASENFPPMAGRLLEQKWMSYSELVLDLMLYQFIIDAAPSGLMWDGMLLDGSYYKIVKIPHYITVY